MDQNIILPEADTGRDDCFSRESILEDDFCLEECITAAEAGDPGAQGVLGDCYQYGWFVKKDYAAAVAPSALETARGLGLPRRRVFRLLLGECFSAILSAWLLAFGRAIAEVGAVSMVGGAIAWKTNVMTTAIMQYTNRGDLSMGIALGAILMVLSLVVDLAVTLLQKGVER